MDYLYPSYMAMSESKLNRHLAKRKFPDALRHKIVELVTHQRKHRANERRKRGQLTPLWEHLMQPLMFEIRLVRSALSYTSRNGERNAVRVEALNAYLIVMTTLYNRFKDLRKANDKSPVRMAKEKDPPLPNGGEHWTDWIPDHIRQRTLALFKEIPKLAHAKTKRPFERRMPPSVHDEIKQRVVKRLENDLAVLETDLKLMEMHPNPNPDDNEAPHNKALKAQRSRVNRAKRAREILEAMHPTEALPITWHALVSE